MDAQTLLDSTRERLRKHEGKYAEIARLSDGAFSYSWLSKVATGAMSNPTVASLQQLIQALDAFEGVEPEPDATAEAQP